MPQRRLPLVVLATSIASACASAALKPPSPRVTIDVGSPPRVVMLAAPRGAPFIVAGSPSEVIRGRVRWHIDPDGGATRASEVTRDIVRTGLLVPRWLEGGLALF